MADQPTSPRRRPVDALFGDGDAATLPSYTVEAAKPVTTVSPPPVVNQPVPFQQPIVEPIGMPEATAPFVPPEAPPVRDVNGEYFSYLADTIRQLYDEVSTLFVDSPTIADYCMKMLLEAREAYLIRDFAAAEFYVQAVDAKLKRSARSARWSRSPVTWLLWLWELALLGGSLAVITISYIPNLTLFGLPVAQELVVLLRALAWGTLGGVLGALFNMPWFAQFREYDPAYNMSYFARPLLGLVIGGVLFLFSLVGLVVGNIVLPGSNESLGPVFLYPIAALAAFKQEYVLEYLDQLLRAIFRAPRVPNPLEIQRPPK